MGIETILLYGKLAEEFGERLDIHADTVPKALQIMEANFFGRFYRALREGEYFVWTDNPDGSVRGYDNPEALMLSTSNKVLHIMPRVEGASNKKGGLMAILGIALVGVAIIASGGTLAAPLAGLQGAMSSGTIWGTVAQLGLGMALSGIGTLLVPMPKMDLDAGDRDDQQSYILSGPINTLSEGGAIPVLYGSPIVGSTVVSAGIDVEQIAVENTVEEEE